MSKAISHALTTEEESGQLVIKENSITCLNWSMSEERSVLRMNLINGLLDGISYNTVRENTEIVLYEVGRVFFQENDPRAHLPQEVKYVAIAISGAWEKKDWQTKAQNVDFSTIRGLLGNLLEQLGIHEDIHYQTVIEIKEMHPERTAAIYLGEQFIGFVGQVHPTIAKSYDIPETYVAGFDLSVVVEVVQKGTAFKAVTKLLAVSRDIALLAKETVINQELTEVIDSAAGRFLTDIQLFDVYQGENIEKGYKSMAYSLAFVNPEATLIDEEINKAMNKVTRALTETPGTSIC